MATMKEASAGKLVRTLAAVRDAKSCLIAVVFIKRSLTYKLILIFRNNLNVYH